MFLELRGCLARVAYKAEEIGEFLFCDKIGVFVVEN